MSTLAKTSRSTYANISSALRRPVARPAMPDRADPTAEPIVTRDGRKLVLRHIRADDVAALQRGFARLSRDEVRLRFLHPLNELPVELAVSLCDLDPRYAVAWVLADPDDVADGEIHAVARVHMDPATEQAEFAIIVQQEICCQGFGHALMLRTIDDARRLGAVEIWGDVLLDNAAMLRLCEKLGLGHTTVAHNPGVRRVTLALDKPRTC
jgi:GNAT superfamily N-acetyltransferase